MDDSYSVMFSRLLLSKAKALGVELRAICVIITKDMMSFVKNKKKICFAFFLKGTKWKMRAANQKETRTKIKIS